VIESAAITRILCIELFHTPKRLFQRTHHQIISLGGKPPPQKIKNMMSANPPIMSIFTVATNAIEIFKSSTVLLEPSQYNNPIISEKAMKMAVYVTQYSLAHSKKIEAHNDIEFHEQ